MSAVCSGSIKSFLYIEHAFGLVASAVPLREGRATERVTSI